MRIWSHPRGRLSSVCPQAGVQVPTGSAGPLAGPPAGRQAAAMSLPLLIQLLPLALGIWVWPVAPAIVVDGFDPPEQIWSAGHRGVDLAAEPGQQVRAIGPGTVLLPAWSPGGRSSRLGTGGFDPPTNRCAPNSIRATRCLVGR